MLQNSISEPQKQLIRLERTKLQNGYKAEKDNAYHIDFYLGENKNTIVLHDIRLSHNGQTAQFDHILVNRLEIYILESKSFKENGILTIKADGSLEIQYGKQVYTQHNPIEQNRRHKKVLASFLKENFSFGHKLAINHKVLIHPETNVSNPVLPNGFARADSFISQRNDEWEAYTFLQEFKGLMRLISKKNMQAVADSLVAHHKPVSFDYTKKFHTPAPTQSTVKAKSAVTDTVEESQGIYQEKDTCPRCKDGKLVIRVSKRKSEKYASNQFYGCTQYPKCRFIKPI
ncbi:NERD domain protein [hydrothermal vent metagenome]|uniref:NERD domain protein n=1 Tax=hydrothermal vent metagenome TaxID=652676 RepID=A0A1W1E0W9_9ZZZZ